MACQKRCFFLKEYKLSCMFTTAQRFYLTLTVWQICYLITCTEKNAQMKLILDFRQGSPSKKDV